MKKVSFLFTAVLLAFFTIGTANAQTVQEKVVWNASLGFECDGNYDWVYGQMELHLLTHLNSNGDVVWAKTQVNAKDLESSSGEKFKLNFKANVKLDGCVQTVFYHFTLVGNLGTKVIYHLTIEYDWCTGTMTVIDEKSKCI